MPESPPPNSIVELVIRVDDVDVNLKELSAYLEFVDRSYGRLTTRGLRSYSHRRDVQLKASFQSGSLEVILEAIAGYEEIITALIILRFLLKYVPAGLKDIASAYRELEEASYTRARRHQLRETAKADEELAELDPKRRNEMVNYFDYVYVRERRILSAVQRFASHHVREIFFRFRRRNDDD